jgi:hypothetical protein
MSKETPDLKLPLIIEPLHFFENNGQLTERSHNKMVFESMIKDRMETFIAEVQYTIELIHKTCLTENLQKVSKLLHRFIADTYEIYSILTPLPVIQREDRITENIIINTPSTEEASFKTSDKTAENNI